MSERPVSATVDALLRLPHLAEQETDDLADDVREQTAHLSSTLRHTSRHPHVASVADEVEALSTQMLAVLGDLPGEIAHAVQAEIAELQGLLAPDTTEPTGDTTAPSIARISGLGDVPAFETPATPAPAVEFSTEAEFNAAADSPRPDTTYRYRDVEWRTDQLARTISVSGTPTLRPATRRPRRQAEIGHQGRPTDVGFHLLGHAFGGPTNPLNVVPGNGYRLEDGLANLNQGAYQQFENEIRRHLKAGHDVRVEIQVIYKPGNTSRRPDKLVVNLSVDGTQQAEYRFKNK